VNLLRILFGSLTSGIIRLGVAAGILFLCYLFIVKPVLKTTDEAIKSSGFDQIGKTIGGLSQEVQREVRHSFRATRARGGNTQRLVHCIRHAHGNVKRIERCAHRF
jgi:hypothetical protein